MFFAEECQRARDGHWAPGCVGEERHRTLPEDEKKERVERWAGASVESVKRGVPRGDAIYAREWSLEKACVSLNMT